MTTRTRRIVDGGHPDMHCRLDALPPSPRESGLPVVGGGGFF